MVKNLLVIGLLMLPSGDHEQRGPASCTTVLAGKIPAAASHRTQPMKYHFSTEYTMLAPEGAETGTHVVSGDFTTSGDSVRWTSVTVGPSAGHGEPATTGEHQIYMEGFAYAREAQNLTSSDFFRGFPDAATDERNLVWDELMFHGFVANLDRLRLNEPVVAPSGDVPLAGSGTFTNRRIELTLVGVGRRNGADCFLIHYEALLNTFTITAGVVTVSGRSDYLGDIWVSIRTRQIEYGTLFEEVAGVITHVPGAPGSQPLHVLRTATLQRRD
jgi:hypothetical protein